ncbi:hypothetical protein GCM10027051_16200 [Niabella terrae]
MELWIDIKGYEGIYQVSTHGNVKSMGSVRVIKGVKQFYPPNILKQSKTNSGYMGVSLWKDGVKRMSLVHRIVAEVFVDNPFRKSDVNHKNGIKTDNRPENLEWCTKSENIRHAIATGLIRRNSQNLISR